MLITRPHESPNWRCLSSARLTSRDSLERIASAEAGFSLEKPRKCGGRPVIAATRRA